MVRGWIRERKREIARICICEYFDQKYKMLNLPSNIIVNVLFYPFSVIGIKFVSFSSPTIRGIHASKQQT